ncbi:hypothetical protein RJ639_008544, partial [Escallonia herrerae]
ISQRGSSQFGKNLRDQRSRSVYVFQREYATVDPALVEFVGTDEATTCVGIVVRSRRRPLLPHLDSPKVVDIGITQMLSLVLDRNSDCILDVHIVGAFEDASPQCTKIIETLEERGGNFHIQTLHVLGHNTRWDSEGNAYPIFTGLLVETSTGSVNPARFDSTSRIPDEIVRRIRVCSSHEDPSWTGRLLETYDTQSDRFVIAPCCWTMRQFRIASTLIELSDPEILLSCSTSPSAEGPNFVDSIRRARACERNLTPLFMECAASLNHFSAGVTIVFGQTPSLQSNPVYSRGLQVEVGQGESSVLCMDLHHKVLAIPELAILLTDV